MNPMLVVDALAFSFSEGARDRGCGGDSGFAVGFVAGSDFGGGSFQNALGNVMYTC